MGRDLSRIVRDLPIEIDLEAARLGDYDRDTVVRLFREYEFRTLIERLPPMAGESAEQRTEALRSVAESGYVPAARVAGRPDGWGPNRGTGRPESGELQLRLDFASVTGPRPEAAASDGDEATGSSNAVRPTTSPVDDLPTALAAAIVDPGRIEVRGVDRIDELADWIAAQPVRRGVPRRRRSTTSTGHTARPRPGRRRRPHRRRRGRRSRRRAPPARGTVERAARRPRGEAPPRGQVRR